MDDNFGRIMLDNLRCRGCELAGVNACISSQTQMDRFDSQIRFIMLHFFLHNF